MGHGGIENILITSPVVVPASIDRLMALNLAISDLMVVVDNADNIAALSAAAQEAEKPLKVFLDLDPGLHRTGIRPGESAVNLAKLLHQDAGFEFMGLQDYAGQLMHIEDFDERRKGSHVVMEELDAMRNALDEIGIECGALTGGGTGTFDIDAEKSVLTELQGGSYIFMDREYNEVGREGGFPFKTSLFVQMTVISNNTPKQVTTDAGFKCFATDADTPLLTWGAPAGASYFFYGDEQGGITFENEEDQLALGSCVRAETPHCDPTINLYDYIHVTQGDTLVDIWRIDTRGLSG